MRYAIILFLLLGFLFWGLALPAQASDGASDNATDEAARVAKTALDNAQKWHEDTKALKNLQDRLPLSKPLKNLGLNKQLIVFASLGMPDDALRQWMQDVARAGGTLVIRGFYGGRLSTTLDRLQELGGDDHDLLYGLNIDPTAFRRLNISHVPVVVVLGEPLGACENAGCVGDPVPEADRIAGNITLEHALRRIEREGTAAPSVARQHLKRLRSQP